MEDKYFKLCSGVVRRQVFKKGAALLLPKMVVDEIHFLETGICKAFWLNTNNEEEIFQIWTAGSVIMLAELMYTGQKNHEIHLAMLEDSELLSLSKEQLDVICEMQPQMQLMIHNIRAELVEIRNLHLRILMRKEGERYAMFCKLFPQLRRLADKDICAFLGISRSTLTLSKSMRD